MRVTNKSFLKGEMMKNFECKVALTDKVCSVLGIDNGNKTINLEADNVHHAKMLVVNAFRKKNFPITLEYDSNKGFMVVLHHGTKKYNISGMFTFKVLQGENS